MASKIYGPKYIVDISGNVKPQNNYLLAQIGNYIYFVDSVDNTLLKKLDILNGTVSTVKDNDYDFVSLWYDRDNGYLYYQYGYEDVGLYWVVGGYIDISDDSDHTVIGPGSLPSTVSARFWDIVLESDGTLNAFTIGVQHPTTYLWGFWVFEAGGGTFTGFETGLASDPINDVNVSKMVVISDWAYYTVQLTTDHVNVCKTQLGVGANITILYDCGANLNLPDNENLWTVSYDGSDVLYFVLKDLTDNKNYLYAYSILNDTLTKGGEFNVALMLDRFTWTATYDSSYNYRSEFFRYEKGYDLSTMKIYQIPRSYTGTLNYIANALRTQPSNTIVAITDSYCIIDNDGTIEIWEYVDLVAEKQIWDIDIIHPEREYPDCTLLWRKTQTNDTNKYFDPPAQDQLLQVYGTYTSTNGVADIVSDESLYLSYRGAHNFSGITTTANYFKGSGGLNPETVGTSGTDIDWVDSVSSTDSNPEYIIVASEDGHYNILKIAADGDNGAVTYVQHRYSGSPSSFEFWWKYIDNGQGFHRVYIYESSGSELNIIQLLVNANGNNLSYYYGDGVGGTTTGSVGMTADTWYHFKIDFDYINNEYDLTINGASIATDLPFVNDRSASGISKIRVQIDNGGGVNALESYIDAPGLVGETDPQGYTYEESWNTLDGDIDELLDEGYTIYGALGGSYIRVTDVGGHNDVLTIYDNQNNIDYGDFVHCYIPFGSNQEYGTVEFCMRSSDATYENNFYLYDGTTFLFVFRIDADKFQYHDGGWNDVGLAASDDTWYHIRIAFECTTGGYESLAQYNWKVWINGVEYGDYGMANNQPHADKIRLLTDPADNGYYCYYDAIDFSWSTNYVRQRNRVLSLDDQIIFEGLTDSHDRNILTDISGISKSTELDTISPKISDYTNYTGKTSGAIITQLISDFCNYITAGTISAGSITWTCPADWSVNGNKSLRSIINEFADAEYFTWSIRPTGELDFDDGSVSSYVTLTNDDNYENPHVNILSEKYNQVIIYGGYVNVSRMGPYTYNNQASQQQHGIITWTKTYAGIYDATDLQTLANNKGLLQGAAPLIWEADRDMIDNKNDFGFIQPHETIYLSEGVLVGDDSDETISSTEAGEYILSVNQYDGLNDDARLKLTDGLLFKESIQTTLPQQNSELITQIASETQQVAYPDASVSSGDHNAEGVKSTFTAGENVVFGDFCYFKSDGKMWKSDADAAATMPIVAMAIETITADSDGLFLLMGIARDDTWNWATIGGLLYGSTTTGEITQTAPAGSGDQVQLVGWAITADIIYFKPDFELTAIP